MRSYKIKEKLEQVELRSYKNLDFQYVVIMTSDEWKERGTDFDMGIEWDIYFRSGSGTRAEVNYDSITGKFSILDRHNMPARAGEFTFSLDEKGIIFVDDNGLAAEIVERIAASKKLFNPCLERFLYDFLEQIIANDAELLASYDRALDEMERQIFNGQTEEILKKIADIRNHLRDLKIHYLELMDVCQELEENENEFFMTSNERYFHLVNQRIQRLYERVTSLVEFTIQLREFCQSKTDEKQNRNLAFLTVISSIFMPLTLIVGWYGMNFKYMPELEERWAYPVTGVICILIVIISITFFKKKKLL